jgi:hypothetical protein
LAGVGHQRGVDRLDQRPEHPVVLVGSGWIAAACCCFVACVAQAPARPCRREPPQHRRQEPDERT